MPEQNQEEQWQRVHEKALTYSVVEMSGEAAYFTGRRI
jgi:hypothetical protein